jgi:hypothetical protein
MMKTTFLFSPMGGLSLHGGLAHGLSHGGHGSPHGRLSHGSRVSGISMLGLDGLHENDRYINGSAVSFEILLFFIVYYQLFCTE